MREIKEYHAHVYYNETSFQKAEEVLQNISSELNVKLGNMHKKPVGPHPLWSCQISVPVDKFSDVTQWLMKNRQGLTVLVHPDTGDDYSDHDEYALWMGSILKLDTSVFR
jgi:aromatic ring-cleaving dioxygenase